jgi:hypothetical protein
MLAPLTGCGDRAASVSGTVTFQGRPLNGGSVILYCKDEQIVRGIIGADGSYSIANVPRGSCRVTVKTHAPIPPGFHLRQSLPPVEDGPIPPPQANSLAIPTTIPERYAMPEESGLAVDVNRPHTLFDITLTP